MEQRIDRDILFSVRGLAITGFILHHLSECTSIFLFSNLFEKLGAPFASIYFFILGHEIISRFNRENDQVNSFIRARLLQIIIGFIFSVIIFNFICILNTDIHFDHIVSEITDRMNYLIPFQWYIIAALISYSVFFIIMFSNLKSFKKVVTLYIVIIVSISLALKIMKFHGFWYIAMSLFSFTTGIIFYLIEPQFIRLHESKLTGLSVIFICLGLITVGGIHLLSIVLFPILTLSIKLITPFQSLRLFKFAGYYSYCLFLIHSILIISFRGNTLNIQNDLFFIGLILILSFLIIYILTATKNLTRSNEKNNNITNNTSIIDNSCHSNRQP